MMRLAVREPKPKYGRWMLAFRSLSLRQKLPLLVSTLTAGALLVAGALASIEVHQAARAAAESRLRTATVELVNLLANTVETRGELEAAIARSPRVLSAVRGAPIDSAALANELDTVRTAADATLPIHLVAANDSTVFTTGESPPGPDPDPDPPLDSVKVFGPFRSLGGQVLYWTSIPVPEPRANPVGWIAYRRRIGSPQARDVIETLLGSGIRLFVGQYGDSVWVDFGGSVSDSPPGDQLVLGEPFTFNLRDGTEVLSTASPLPGTPWVLLLQTPMSQVLARPRAFLSRMLLMGASLILLVVMIAWSATRRLAGPLEELAEAADHIAGGKYRHRVSASGDDELARLAYAFNAMSEQVARSDEELRRRLQEARALALSLEEANVRAERSREEAHAASRAKSEFLATMSHELRTPINAVLGYTELLAQGIPDPPTESQSDYLRRIERSSRMLISLVDDVLDFSRIESGRMRLDLGIGSALSAVRAATASLEPEAARKGVAMTARCGQGGRFHGDQQRVQQILLNLLSNAVKFTPSGGSVEVRCSVVAEGPEGSAADEGPWLRIDVEDTGIGIDEDQLDRVFEPFVQGKVGFTREHGGAGLGLAISRSLASMMSGHLTVRSTRGEGSCFTLWLRSAGVADPAGAPL
jgi:signal transduction histidine kinase